MTKNLENITIHKFRGLRDLELQNLGYINLLVGINNSGKTSVLEALSIYCHPLDLGVWISTSRQREQDYRVSRIPFIDTLQGLFTRNPLLEKNKVVSGSMVISSQGAFAVNRMKATYTRLEEILINEQQLQRNESEESDDDLIDPENEEILTRRKGINLQLEVYTSSEQLTIFNHLEPNIPEFTKDYLLWENEPFTRFPRRLDSSLATAMVTPSSHRSDLGQFRLLSDAKLENFKTDVIALLRQMDQNISDIDILLSPASISSRFTIYIQHKKLRFVPVSTFGDGVRRLLHIALKLASVKGGILLIDELESAIHTEALETSFRWLVKWCKTMNVQLFATTHSLEALDSLLEVTEGESDLVFYRLEPKENHTRVVRHDWNRLKSLREELGQEVR
jgi:predicted ATP-dependent endonuclease of OLD family